MMTSEDISYCWAPGCKHKECRRHYSQLEGYVGVATFSDFSKLCNMYEKPVMEDADDSEENAYYMRAEQ